MRMIKAVVEVRRGITVCGWTTPQGGQVGYTMSVDGQLMDWPDGCTVKTEPMPSGVTLMDAIRTDWDYHGPINVREM